MEEPRATATTRVAAIVRALPYLLAALLVSGPLMFAWGSFLVYYDKAWEAFGDGRVFAGVANLLLVTLLVVFVACVTLTFILASKSLGAAVWQWSEDKPTLRAGLASARFGLASAAVIAAIVGLFTWLPSQQAASDSRTLKESLKEAGSQVATVLAPDGASALAATEEPEAPPEPDALEPYFPEQEEPLVEAPAEPVVTPQRGKERGKDPAPNKSAPSNPAPNEPAPNEPAANEPAPNEPASEQTTVPDPTPLALADPAFNEAAFVPEESAFDSIEEPAIAEKAAALPVDPVVAPDSPAPSVPQEDEVPPEDETPPEEPPLDTSDLPKESDTLQYNLPENPTGAPREDPTPS